MSLDGKESYSDLDSGKINNNIKSVLESTLDDFLEINIPEIGRIKSDLENLLNNYEYKLKSSGEDYIIELSNILNNLGQKVYNSTIRNYEEFKALELEEMLYIFYNFGGDCNHISIFYKKLFDNLGLKSKIANINSHSDVLLNYNNKYYLVDSNGINHIKIGTKIMGFNGDISLINDEHIFINENRGREDLKIDLINELSDFTAFSSGKISIHLRNFNKGKRTLDLEYLDNGVEFNFDGMKYFLPDTLIGSAIYKLKRNDIKGFLEFVVKSDEFNFFAHFINSNAMLIFLEKFGEY